MPMRPQSTTQKRPLTFESNSPKKKSRTESEKEVLHKERDDGEGEKFADDVGALDSIAPKVRQLFLKLKKFIVY